MVICSQLQNNMQDISLDNDELCFVQKIANAREYIEIMSKKDEKSNFLLYTDAKNNMMCIVSGFFPEQIIQNENIQFIGDFIDNNSSNHRKAILLYRLIEISSNLTNNIPSIEIINKLFTDVGCDSRIEISESESDKDKQEQVQQKIDKIVGDKIDLLISYCEAIINYLSYIAGSDIYKKDCHLLDSCEKAKQCFLNIKSQLSGLKNNVVNTNKIASVVFHCIRKEIKDSCKPTSSSPTYRDINILKPFHTEVIYLYKLIKEQELKTQETPKKLIFFSRATMCDSCKNLVASYINKNKLKAFVVSSKVHGDTLVTLNNNQDIKECIINVDDILSKKDCVRVSYVKTNAININNNIKQSNVMQTRYFIKQ